MKEIPLYNRKHQIVAYAIIDDEDVEFTNQWMWHLSKGYVKNNHCNNMHVMIYEHHFGKNPKKYIDHIDKNPLNNKLNNLRPANDLENTLNRKLGKNNTSGFFGVKLDRTSKNIRYQACASGHYIGSFDNIRLAAIARDIYMKDFYPKEFLTLNILDATQEEIDKIRKILNNPKKRRGLSEFLGVYFYKNLNKPWRAKIYFNNKTVHIGYFQTEQEAKDAYVNKYKEYYG